MKRIYLLLLVLLTASRSFAVVAPITGTFSVCVGSTTSLASTTTGGTWSSAVVAVGTVNAATGVVTGIAAGTTTITYTVGSEYEVATVTVNPLPAAITGAATVCEGTSTTLGSGAGGIWSVLPGGCVVTGGVVTGITAGTSIITYTSPLGCSVTKVVTIYATPPAITGSLAFCNGNSTTLFNTMSGGTWASMNSGIAPISSTSGIATGISSGTTAISYTLPTGCAATAVVTVQPLPSVISGMMQVCDGSTSMLSNATPGGVWSSSAPVVAIIGSATGVLTGINVGTATITYTIPGTGCTRLAVITVNPVPPAITGLTTVCLGGTTTLSNVVPGGAWSSGNPAIATVDFAGVVTGNSAGITGITYGLGTGCMTMINVTVNPTSGGAISGSTSVCTGGTTTLSHTVAGGTWASSNTAIAFVGASSGIMTGVSGGVTYISYMQPAGCISTIAVTVNTVPPITGIPTVCTGLTTTLSNAMAGGTWSDGGSSIASVSSTGVVTGVATGTANITYTAACGAVTKTVTVVASIPAITGPATMCEGTSVTFSNAASGGTWSTSGGFIAIIGSTTGILNTLTSGAVTVSYTVGTCGSVTAPLTVNPMPATITGVSSLCVGATTTFSTASTGGLWSITGAPASIGFTTGIAAGVSAGTTNVVYTLPTGCTNTRILTVNAIPVITGPATVCVGGTSTLTGSGGTAWFSGTPSVATINTSGIVSGVALGTSVITRSNSTTGCMSTYTMAATSACTGTPTAGTAVASGTTCSGTTVTLSLTGASVVCGVTHQWQSSPDGTTWANISGATSATYAASSSTPKYYHCVLTCPSSGLSATSSSLFFNPVLTIASHTTVSVPDTACGSSHFYVTACGMSSTFTMVTYFGDGTSSSGTLSLTGGVYNAHIYHYYSLPGTYTVKHVLYNSGVAVDSTTYAYDYMYCRTLPIKLFKDNNSNCVFDAGDVNNTIAATVRVDSAGIPIDTLSCTSGLYYKAKGTPGTIYAFRVLSIAGSMVVACPSGGVIYDTIVSYANTYTPKYFGVVCGASTGHDLAVSSTVQAGRHTFMATILVTNTQCTPVSPVVTLQANPKYQTISTWGSYPAPSSFAGNIVTWNLSSLAAGASQTIVLYMERSGGMAAWLIPGDTILSSVSVGPISGDVDASNNTRIRIDTVKSSFDPNDIAVSPEGYILPCTQLQYTVRFENDGNDTAHNIYVLDTLSGNLDPASIEVVNASHPMYVSVINDGVRNIAKFDFPNIKLLDSSYHGLCQGMFIYKIKAKNALADGVSIANRAGIYFDDNPVVMTNEVANTIGVAPINGLSALCTSATVTLSSASAGGVWSSSTGAATVAGGVVNGVSAGSPTISYAVSNSCGTRYATKAITVNTVPALSAITGTAGVCVGSTTTLSNSTLGGVWSGGTAGIATVGATGVVSGIGTGTAAISYVATNTCGSSTATKVVTVDATPSAGIITGTAGVCVGGTTTLASTVSGGTWSVSSGGTIATVSSSGIVTGVAAGTATVFYYVTNSCATDIASIVVTVNTMPVAGTITGIPSVCIGTPVTFSTTGTGGAWSSGSTAIATASSSGVVAGASAGSTLISYAKTNSCGTAVATYAVTVNPVVTPAVSIAPASATLCAGTVTTFTATPVFGGSAPVYLWRVNGIAVGSGAAYGYVPATGDVVSVRLTSNANCATPDTANDAVTLTVLPVGLPTVSTTASPVGAVCEGSLVTFTPTAALGGTTPIYMWYANGVYVSTGATYSYTPLMGDVVFCRLVSDYQCRLADTVSSSSTTMVVDPAYVPVVSLTAAPGFTVSSGVPVTFTAATSGAGPVPTYQWYLNGLALPGATNSIFTASALAEGDAICCKVTGSGACAVPTTSCDVVHISTGIHETLVGNAITVFPNPTNGSLTLEGTVATEDGVASVEILDVLGQVVYSGKATIIKGHVSERIQLNTGLANGMYVLHLRSLSTTKEIDFVLMH